MNNNFDNLTPMSPSEEPPPPPRPPQRTSGFVILIAWLVILAVVVLIVRRQFVEEPPRAKEEKPGLDLATNVFMIQSRALVAYLDMVESLAQNQPNNPDVNPQEVRTAIAKDLATQDTGTVEQRLGTVIMRGELLGPQAALESLETLHGLIKEKEHPLTDREQELLALLNRLYSQAARQRGDKDKPAAQPAEPILTPDEQQVLHDRLGWYGDLAGTIDENAPPGLREGVLRSGQKSLVVLGVVVAWFLLVGLTGLIGLGVMGIGLLVRGVRSRVTTGAGGGVYAETFALWMVVFLGMSWLVQHFAPPPVQFLLIILVFFSSLLTLAWPVLRGVPWQQVREDIGWTRGPAGFFEPFVGVGCYAMTLPLLVPGVCLLLVFAAIAAKMAEAAGVVPPTDTFTSPELPSHPIVGELANGGWWLKIQVLFLGVIAAPIVEETMFRGVLYRHLREGSRGLGIFLSVLFSGTVASFLFAVIHPQGLIAVPVLMAMAFGFAFTREWRGSLISSMVAHCLVNLVTMVTILNLFSS